MKPRKVAVMGSFLTLVRETWKHLPQLVRFLLLHAAIGIGAGWLLLALLLWTDVNGVGSLIWASDSSCARRCDARGRVRYHLRRSGRRRCRHDDAL